MRVAALRPRAAVPGRQRQYRWRRAGTVRAGSAERVSPVGEASARSKSVNASMASVASQARLRRPTVAWVRIPARTNRSIASLAAVTDRPIISATPLTVTIGNAGKAVEELRCGGSSPDAAEPVPPVGFESVDAVLEAAGVHGGAGRGGGERGDPVVHAVDSGGVVGWTEVAERRGAPAAPRPSVRRLRPRRPGPRSGGRAAGGRRLGVGAPGDRVDPVHGRSRI